jgi:hypothetical protein
VVREYLSTSKGDLDTCSEKIDVMLANQFGEIHSSFGRRITILENRYKDVTLYSGLGGHMSRQAMNFIFVEEECAIGKPCASIRKLADVFKGRRMAYLVHASLLWKSITTTPIRLDELHPYWQKLYMGEEESNGDLFSVAEEWRGIQERLERVPFQMKLVIKEGLRLLAFTETTMLSPVTPRFPNIKIS